MLKLEIQQLLMQLLETMAGRMKWALLRQAQRSQRHRMLQLGHDFPDEG
jgi:hypothetical protein